MERSSKAPDIITRQQEDAHSKLEIPALSQQKTVESIITKYSSVFAKSLNGSTIRTQSAQIQLTVSHPIKCKARTHSKEDIKRICEQISRLERNGIIEVSKSPFASNCRLVPKKNGKQHLIINYIPINRVAVKDDYPLPLITDIIGVLADQQVFSVLDATEGFHQVKIDPKSRHFTAFLTPMGLYKYTRVPFGFVNSPAIFQRAMNEVLGPGLYKRCAAYVDDIIVFGRTEEEHNDNLEWVLNRCKLFNLKISPAKCQIAKREVQFLGKKLSVKGVAPIRDSLDAISSIDAPKSAADVRAILGLLQFVAKYVANFSELIKPLVEMTRKDIEFQWTSKHKDALDQILAQLKEARPSVIPNNFTCCVKDE